MLVIRRLNSGRLRATALLRQQPTLVIPTTVAPDSCRDPDDLAIPGTLLTADADLLVIGDNDLLDLKTFGGRPIMTPPQFHDWIISQ